MAEQAITTTTVHAVWPKLVDARTWSFCGVDLHGRTGDTPWFPLNGNECKRCVKLVEKHARR